MSVQDAETDLDSPIAVAMDKLVIGTSLPFDVFIKNEGRVTPLFNKGTVYGGGARNILLEKGIATVYVKASESGVLEGYLSGGEGQRRSTPDPDTYQKYLSKKDEFYLLDRTLLIPGQKITFSLFTLSDFRINVLLPATEQLPLPIDEKVTKTSGDIMIMPTDIGRYHAYLNSLLATETLVKAEHEKVQSIVIKENSKLVLKDLLENPRSGEKIKESIIVVNKMVDNILDNKGAVYDLLSLRTYDYYTYTHSVNVAVLSVGMGMAVGLPKEQIRRLGIGAMLHDVGKSTIPSSIINKAGRLDDDEYRIIKSHVDEGEKILRMNPEIPEESYFAVLQHHERLSGKGYPNSKMGREIHLFGRITSIVDCYDALTTTRTYQAARTPFFALSILTKETGDYDIDVLKSFIQMLGAMKM